MKKTIAQILVMVLLLAVVCSAIPAAAAEQSTVLYTMDAGSRPATAACLSRAGYESYVDAGDGNMVLKFNYTGGKGTIQDQSCYFSLPSDVWTAYGTPTKLTFRSCSDAKINFADQVYFSATATNIFANSDSVLSPWQITTWTTYTINLTTGAGLAAVTNNFRVLNFRNKWSSTPANNSATYFYIDDVTLYYEAAQTPTYTVTLDGSETEVEEGQNYTFPESSDPSFIAYTDGTDYYQPGEEVTVNSDLTFTSFSLGLQMIRGAAMRYNVKTGMRFYTTCNPDALATLYNAGAFTGAGTLIAPVNLLGNNNLTKDIDESIFADCQYKATELYTEGSFSGIVGSLVDIKLENVNRQFVGRGYVDIDFNGIKKTLYASYADGSITNNSRTICFIAKEISESPEYATLDADKKAVVDYYTALYA